MRTEGKGNLYLMHSCLHYSDCKKCFGDIVLCELKVNASILKKELICLFCLQRDANGAFGVQKDSKMNALCWSLYFHLIVSFVLKNV